ncbi:VOC family protein [Jatrophihabitans sp. DSM 45814]
MQIVIDAHDPSLLAAFWAGALGYELDAPPPGFETWPDFLRAQNVPESEWNSASAVRDPAGLAPRVFIQRVPEPKTVKNRVHIDLQSGGGPTVDLDEQRRRVDADIERLVALGASHLQTRQELGIVWAVMQDPEGNEFCT